MGLLYYGSLAPPTRFRRPSSAVGAVFPASCRPGGPLQDRAQGFEIRRNVVYATHDGIELAGDLYRPPGPGPFPYVVNVHGGYWRRGSRDTFRHWGHYLAQRG